MAAIIPLSFEAMRDEVLRRMGKLNVPDWEPRIEQFITAAYYDIAVTFHHYELEDALLMALAEDTKSVTWRFNSDVQYPNGDVYSVLGIRLRDVEGKLSQATQEHIKFIWQEVRERGRPEKWARIDPQGKTIIFDRESDADYDVEMLFYRYPDAPDFGGGGVPAGSLASQLGLVWTEHIMQRAMFLAAPATWRYDMSQVQVQTLQEWLQSQPQAPTKGDLVARAEVPLTSQVSGGNQ
jgi:hypothetical protein